MSPKTAQSSIKTSSKSLKNEQVKETDFSSQPVTKREESNIFNIFKSFLAVGGDFV